MLTVAVRFVQTKDHININTTKKTSWIGFLDNISLLAQAEKSSSQSFWFELSNEPVMPSATERLPTFKLASLLQRQSILVFLGFVGLLVCNGLLLHLAGWACVQCL